MRLIFTLLLTARLFAVFAQPDTLVWDASKLYMVNQQYKDGYHIFKKNGVIIKEFKLVNGKAAGLCKEHYDNGNLKLMYENSVYPFSLTGMYCEYYESGKIKTDGWYAFADSIECVNCYDVNNNKRITKANSHCERAGEWQEFFENGRLKSTGCYKGIHETVSVDFNKPTNGAVFSPGSLAEEYLKDKLWYYYNEAGQLIKEEFYFKGSVADVSTYTY